MGLTVRTSATDNYLVMLQTVSNGLFDAKNQRNKYTNRNFRIIKLLTHLTTYLQATFRHSQSLLDFLLLLPLLFTSSLAIIIHKSFLCIIFSPPYNLRFFFFKEKSLNLHSTHNRSSLLFAYTHAPNHLLTSRICFIIEDNVHLLAACLPHTQ